MCHNNLEILEKLVHLLDDPRNDIYIHVDRKAGSLAQWRGRIHTDSASLTFTKRISVNWGGFSQIHAELILLEAAAAKKHAYYHLLSGADLPIKTQDDIHFFFECHHGAEFIGIDEADRTNDLFSQRLQYYRYFQDHIGRRTGLHIACLEYLENFSLAIQKIAKVNRMRQDFSPYKGPNWFSITHQMALYVLSQKDFIHSHFKYTLGCDELFLQTLAMNSPYAENVVNNTLRYIDWHRGSPYTFRSEDFDLLISSGKLFARKFDENTDVEIVEKICCFLEQPDGEPHEYSIKNPR